MIKVIKYQENNPASRRADALGVSHNVLIWCLDGALGRRDVSFVGRRNIIMIRNLIISVIMAFVGVMFLLNFTPVLETEVAAAILVVTDPFTLAMIGIVGWALPVAGFIGIIVNVFKIVGNGGSRG